MSILYHFRVRGVGAERVHIAGIAKGFRELGHPVQFVSPFNVNPLEDTEPEVRANSSKPSVLERAVHAAADVVPQIAFEAMELAYNGVAVPKLLNQLQRRRYGFIYERYAFFNLAGALASKLSGAPLLVEVNELAGYERVREQRLVSLAQRIENIVFNHATLVVTVSDFLTERVSRIVEGRVPVVTIPNGVAREWLTSTPSPSRVDAIRRSLGLVGRRVIAFSGGLVHWHNFGPLIEAVARVRQSVPNLVLMLVGDGVLKGEIQNMAERLRVSDALVFAGTVPHRQVADYLSAAEVAVVPHTNEYRSPIKMFEYMGLGKVVVAPAMAPIRRVIQDRQNGFLFEAGNVDSLTRTLKEALLSGEHARRVGEAARQLIARDFTWEQHAERIVELMRQRLLQRSESARAAKEIAPPVRDPSSRPSGALPRL